MEVAYGECHCGCGGKTALSTRTQARKGLVSGEPRKWLRGHCSKVTEPRPGYAVEDRGYKTPCWIYQGYIDHGGYAQAAGRPAHHLYYEKKFGPIPEGLEPDHLCKVRCCVNPDHLEPVTHAVNCQRSSRAKLSVELAAEIRALSAGGLSQRSIAEKLGVSKSAIKHVLKGRSWRI